LVEPLIIGMAGEREQVLLPHMANRHGIVTGATGTGKTVTIQTIIERFSDIGVPVFVTDVKGDVAGLGAPGGGNDKVDARLAELGLPPLQPTAYPVVFWDVYGELGHPVRTTISELGPLLLARLLESNDTQTGVLHVAFAYADDNQLPLIDLADLRALLADVAEKRKDLSITYGNVSPASVAAIQRALLRIEQGGGNTLFGEPSLDLRDFMRTAPDGRGIVNVLSAERLFHDPVAYATFLFWMLSELFESMPEVGDPEKPVLALFFDEAHLLFDNMPKSLSDRIEQVVRLIRSKGLGVYFISQMPIDVPETILGQLGNRVQHALRAYTPRDQKSIRAVAETFRENESFDVEQAVTELGVGEALVSFLEEKGAPSVVERAKIIPPKSRIGVLDAAERAAIQQTSPFAGKYDQFVDRESAYEILRDRMRLAELEAEVAAEQEKERLEREREREQIERQRRELEREESRRSRSSTASRRRQPKDSWEDFLDDAASSLGRELGRSIGRNLLGSLRRR
jgi:uncharacterized protein